MCYKPEMRKWMSERLKRRKKEPEKAGTAAQAPLQPAFYDTEPAHQEPAAEVKQATPSALRPESAQEMRPIEPQGTQPSGLPETGMSQNVAGGGAEVVVAAAGTALRLQNQQRRVVTWGRQRLLRKKVRYRRSWLRTVVQ